MDEEMENTPTYMTVELLSQITGEFEWPAPYTFEDDSPDGVIMSFPKCTLYFAEGVDSEVEVDFLTEETKTPYTLEVIHALSVLIPDFDKKVDPYDHLELIEDTSIGASEEKLKNDLRDKCTLIITYLSKTLLGDFSWVEQYKLKSGRK